MDIYTDGACVPNPGKGSWAYVIWENNAPAHYLNGVIINSTNNVVELTAIEQALKYGLQEKPDSLTIYSDSQYAIKCILGEYKKIKKNIEIILEAREIILSLEDLGISVNLEWVRGHNGNPGNEAADWYANILLKDEPEWLNRFDDKKRF